MFDGFIKTAAATPEIRVADCKYNAGQICLQGYNDNKGQALQS